MFTALDINGNKISAENASKGKEYFCPICNGKLCLKDGSENAKHFAHLSLQDCDDFTYDMSEWHRAWQEKFPLKNREVVIEHNGEKHRADVLAYGYVVEFQHSPISREEFNRRNDFYIKAGKKVVWVFDVIYEFKNKRLEYNPDVEDQGSGDDYGGVYKWSYSKKCFKDFVPQEQKNIILFFQKNEQTSFLDDCEDSYIERVMWSMKDKYSGEANFKEFYTSYSPANKTELLDWMKNGKL